jgi:hypothetical protein
MGHSMLRREAVQPRTMTSVTPLTVSRSKEQPHVQPLSAYP